MDSILSPQPGTEMNLHDIKLDWWIEDTMRRVTESQKRKSEDALQGLPFFINPLTGNNRDDRGHTIPFGTGPHSFESFEFWSKVIPVPSQILEIGFNLGHGAAALLSLFPDSKLVSVDIRDSSEVHNAHNVLARRFPGRHELVIGDSATVSLPFETFEAAFIDGAHDLKSIVKDINKCREYGVKYFLMDDVHPRHGDTLEAIKQTGLKLQAIVGANMAICEDV